MSISALPAIISARAGTTRFILLLTGVVVALIVIYVIVKCTR